MFKKILKYLFKIVGYELKKIGSNKDFWQTNESFLNLYEEIKDKTLVSVDRCFMIYQYANFVKNFKGEVAELGVYKGGTSKMISEIFKNKKVYLFDTFNGMPITNDNLDLHKKGDFFDTSLKSVSDYLKNYKNIIFKEGFFPETTNGIENEKFCFVHIDADIYESIINGLNFFYNKMVNGGVIVIDDYEGKHCPGVKKAVDEFTNDRKIKPIITTKAQCVLIKN